MKNGFLSLAAAILVSSTGFTQEARIPTPGCLDCFNFVAPSILDAGTVNPAEIGLIVYDSYFNSFRGFSDNNGSGYWQKLSNELMIRGPITTTTLYNTDDVVLVNAASSALTEVLPAASTATGKVITVRKSDSSVNAVTVDGYSTETIDGVATKTISGQNESISLLSNGTSWLVVGKVPRTPTVTVKTTGNGTYSTPPGATYLKVKMVGGGGGGGASGTSGGGTANDGYPTTFGSSFLTANGGKYGVTRGSYAPRGAGGTATVSSPAISLFAISGGSGGGSGAQATTSTYFPGGIGGNSCFGGGGASAQSEGGQDGAANSGGGGAGAGTNGISGSGAGQGGGAGGCLEAIIANPSSSYGFAVGDGGTGAASGINGYGGGAGAKGIIIIEEHYE